MDRAWQRLALVGGLAMAACHLVIDQPPGPPSYAYPTYPAASYRTSPYPAPSYTAAPYAAAARPPPQAPEPRPASRASYVEDGRPATTSLAAPAPACLDSASVDPPDCAFVRRAPARCALETNPRQRCSGYRIYFDPKVAASAVSCLSSLPSHQLCDEKRATDCGKIALAEACIDPSVEELCQVAQVPCKTTASNCAASLSGLNDRGQQIVAECVAHGCEGGLDGCLDALTARGDERLP